MEDNVQQWNIKMANVRFYSSDVVDRSNAGISMGEPMVSHLTLVASMSSSRSRIRGSTVDTGTNLGEL